MRVPMATVATLLAWGVNPSGDAAPVDQKAHATAVARAKELKASSIDTSLQPVRLADWLGQAIGDPAVKWFVSDCDLKSETRQRPESRLLCIGAEASERSRIYLRFHLVVGSWARGVSGAPRVLPQSFVACNPLDYDAIDSIRPFRKLSELPPLVAYLRETCPTAK
jgi:hypothetical protein